MSSSESGVWYESLVSLFDKEGRVTLRSQYKVPRTFKIKVPKCHHHPSRPPLGYRTFFLAQLEGGLRFPVPEFFENVAEYFEIPLNQLAPNFFRLLCAAYLVFKVYDIPLNPTMFHYFFALKRKEEGVFYFTARVGFNFLDSYPSSLRGWKDTFFFVRPPLPLFYTAEWQCELPSQPALGDYRNDPTFLRAAERLEGLKFNVGSLVGEEGLLYRAGLSPITVELTRSLGTISRLTYVYV